MLGKKSTRCRRERKQGVCISGLDEEIVLLLDTAAALDPGWGVERPPGEHHRPVDVGASNWPERGYRESCIIRLEIISTI